MTELQRWVPFRRRTAKDVPGAFTLSGLSVSTPGAVQYVPGTYVLFNQQQDVHDLGETALPEIAVIGEFAVAVEPAVLLVKDYLDVFDSANAAVESFSSSFHVAPFWPRKAVTDAAFGGLGLTHSTQ